MHRPHVRSFSSSHVLSLAALALLGSGVLVQGAACAVDAPTQAAPTGPTPADHDGATSLPPPSPAPGGAAPSPSPSPDAATDAAADAADAAADAGPKPPFACQSEAAFPATLAVPEASAAAELELLAGVRELLVVSDSGRGGAALLLGIPGGAQRSLTLDLDPAASDDTEGIAWRAGALYTLTSSGAVRRFVPNGQGGLTRDQNAYALGAPPSACADLSAVNCGRNYEGLCLRAPGVVHPCAGYAASKAEGKLYCVDIDPSGKLFAKTSVPPLTLSVPAEQLSDCAFGAAGGAAAGVLAVTTNVFGLSRSYRVDETTGALTKLPAKALLNVEAIAIDRDGALYVFDDNSTTQSGAAKASCVGW